MNGYRDNLIINYFIFCENSSISLVQKTILSIKAASIEAKSPFSQIFLIGLNHKTIESSNAFELNCSNITYYSIPEVNTNLGSFLAL